jgi:hypothetical protein
MSHLNWKFQFIDLEGRLIKKIHLHLSLKLTIFYHNSHLGKWNGSRGLRQHGGVHLI